jgi:hypothetical protein
VSARSPRYRDVEPITDLVTDEECYEAMQFADHIAHDYAVAIAAADRAAYRLRMIEAAGVMVSTQKSDARRQAEARISNAFAKAVEEQYDAQVLAEELKAKRAAAQQKVDVWRTIHADKRQRDVAEPGRR